MSDIKTRIIDAARALYRERGADAVTMRAVAERVGVTATALYRHFPDKDAILREVMSEGSRLLGSHLFLALEAPTALDRLRATAAAYLEFAVAQPQAYRSLFEPAGGDESSPALRQRDAVRRFLRDRVREGIADGALVDGNAEEIALALWATLHGLASLHQAGIIPADTLSERTLTPIIDNLAPHAGTGAL
ncbi:MAG TPA: TetR/AcrR family transcriptional regulator [Longimicrobium sp.]|jgi:AcrR family transcriptional regulator|uniref:TetR/AcrR family transcriptional regulator n=1 Tax=Longimicrobium sp. TaxID=2029185 RepID=UPI002EDAD301